MTPKRDKKPTGRPTKLNDEVAGKIYTAVTAGNYLEVSASYAGIARRTFFDWVKRGRKDLADGNETKFSEFVIGLDEAMAKAEARFVAIIAAKAPTTWQAAAWWLERRYPKRWGLRDPDKEQEEGAQDDELLEHQAWLEKVKGRRKRRRGRDS